MTENDKEHPWEFITFAAAAMLMITMGARQSLGLFVAPLNTATGLGIVTISFAMAVGQFVWGAVQPIAGAVADRYGTGRVLVAGVLILALGSALTPFHDDRSRTRADHRTTVGHGFRRWELFSVDRRGRAALAGGASRHSLGYDQRGRLLRAVRLCAVAANADFSAGLDVAPCGLWRSSSLAALPLARVLRGSPSACHHQPPQMPATAAYARP